MYHHYSDASTWTTALNSLLRPAINSSSAENAPGFVYPPGDIWREYLLFSIVQDLGWGREHRKIQRGRRFLKLERFGLSGLLFYEIPVCEDSTCDHTTCKALTLELVNQNPHMDVDSIFSVVNARLVYFPSYACTSFVIGHVMNALLHDQPGLRPVPAHAGFSVNTHSFDPERHLFTDTSTDGSYRAKPVMNLSGYLRPTAKHARLGISPDALCLVRLSKGVPGAGACPPYVGEPRRPSTPGFRFYGEDAELSDEAEDSMELSTPTSAFKKSGYITIAARTSNSSDEDLAPVLDSLCLSNKSLLSGPANGKSVVIVRPREGGASFIC
ncbi:hypothetical protein BD779DRAFT_1469516 [Infundibulicybe gibba]|nr:hypothetical protein BD779DRAFT_1469516 [Infundibulicybe gibba]